MLFLSSPAKRLDFSMDWSSNIVSEPVFNKNANKIAHILKKYPIQELAKKLKISTKLAELNYDRYQSWESSKSKNLKPAILAYQGDVYKALDIHSLNDDSSKYLQANFRILTGMYGLLKPYDLMQAYRLEMKIKLGEDSIDSLYDFWSTKVTEELNNQLKESNHTNCINLASNEYSKVIDLKKLSKPMINIKFTQIKNGNVKSIGILNKRARGLMLRFAAKTKAKTINDLVKFNEDSYKIESKSTNELVFLKK